MRALAGAWLVLPGLLLAHPCESCHPKEVQGYERTGMGRSLREPAHEPDGQFDHAKSGTRFLVRSNQTGLYQRMQHAGENSDFRIDYVIGSGTHASCYLATVGDHLFESPICYYPARGYAMAPGFDDNPAPGYTRPITMECLLCHSGKPMPIAGSLNMYESPAFSREAISCDRCHGDPAGHLKKPVPGSIVNPAKLAAAQRDSICERCHLAGAIRELNPGKSFSDFQPGQALESVFTTYVAAGSDGHTGPMKVVSQSEQFARSHCAVASKGKMWCGTCHDPHEQPGDPAAYYRTRCLACHQAAFSAAHPPRTSNCLACHMPRRDAVDGGHTAFTDHRIERRPAPEGDAPPPENLKAWREPAAALRQRNLALAFNNAGIRYSAGNMVTRSYSMLLEVQKGFPSDSDVLTALGAAALERNEPAAAARLFERAIETHHDDPSLEDSAGRACLQAGDKRTAARHFERALMLDPLLLPTIEELLGIYREQSEQTKEAALMNRVREAMKTPVRPATTPRH
jgi:hypothetical protein